MNDLYIFCNLICLPGFYKRNALQLAAVQPYASICSPGVLAHPATELTPERCNPPVTVAGGPDDLIRDPRNVEPAPNVLTPLAPMPWLPTGLLLDTPIQLAVPPWPPLEWEPLKS
uniref:Uncharacterized protein n=1 Tax=Glossina austeni TaxID=7395 RepID=A0A1A9UHC0_GLOAU